MNRRVATVFIDALLLFLLVLVILPHEPAPRATPTVDLFAELIVGARWPDGTKADVDLWVRAPGGHPIGYSRTRGEASSLTWDDVGVIDEPPWRYEAAIVREARDGEYVVNLHLYLNKGAELPIPVEVVAWRKLPNEVSEIWSGRAELLHQGQEITVVRFELRDGRLLPGSAHDAHLALRPAR